MPERRLAGAVRAAWRHHGPRDAVEVVDLEPAGSGWRLRGVVTGVEAGVAFGWHHEVEVGADWVTRHARLVPQLCGAPVEVHRGPDGSWRVDGVRRPDLDGLVDVDLECSVMTNTLPVHRLGLLTSDEPTSADAAYVGLDGRVTRLAQTYGPASSGRDGCVDVGYDAPAFDVRCRLTYDASGLLLAYPGLATRLL